MIIVYNKGRRVIQLKTGKTLPPAEKSKLTDDEANQVKQMYSNEFVFFYPEEALDEIQKKQKR